MDVTQLASAERFIPTRVGNMEGASWSNWFEIGSSPRVWGTCNCHFKNRRIKPVHPHACGEHDQAIHFIKWPTRFIPTRVGNICMFFRCGKHNAVHPHACGEHEEGSQNAAAKRRFIPTRVGNIVIRPHPPRLSAVHPHACGEHFPGIGRAARVITVHPHACGEHQTVGRQNQNARRFIPTRVGNMTSFSRPRTPNKVHPHACGEHAVF